MFRLMVDIVHGGSAIPILGDLETSRGFILASTPEGTVTFWSPLDTSNCQEHAGREPRFGSSPSVCKLACTGSAPFQ